MFKQKYIVEAPPTVPDLITDKYLCIGCGKPEFRQRLSVKPLPNIAKDSTQSRFNCLMGLHLFAPEEKLTPNDTSRS